MRASCTTVLIVLLATMTACGGGSSSSGPAAARPAFVPNSLAFWDNPKNWTTAYGPAFADISLASSNFLPCRGGPFALCYYSGPSPDTCTPSADGQFAGCQCFEIPYGAYFVDINAILNYAVYKRTVAQCGADGSQCAAQNSAPVCQSINQGTLIPNADSFSAFSFDCVPTNGIGQTNCGKAAYAGCMTAPCYRTGKPGTVDCQCPVFDGPYQLGQTLPAQECTLDQGLVWSAAYAPPAPTAAASPALSSAGAATHPTPPSCVPDAPAGAGCPLFVPGKTVIPPNSHVDCAKVCSEYDQCRQSNGVQTGYTCDSTLCTDNCNDTDLVQTACTGLSTCDVTEIIKAESAAQCSCCASQLCGCSPTPPTNTEITVLNQLQRKRGITPQCDVNGTLCGTAP
ncbi:MAG TPA: hypothetical protein VGH29_17395 [Candidatus Binataceae bacterium]